MDPTALAYMAVLLLPLTVQIARAPAVWVFFAAAVGFALAPLAHMALAHQLGSGANAGWFQDNYYIVSRSPTDAFVGIFFTALAVGQYVKTRLAREDRRSTSFLFWVLLVALLGMRVVENVVIPTALTPGRYLDSATALRPWAGTLEAFLVIAAVALAALIALMVLVPFWRRVT